MPRPSKRQAYITVVILFHINLLNYMDRFTVAGVLTKIEKYFKIDHDISGLLQTVFIVTYMILAPVFGYLGDRFNRKIIMIFGLIAWSASTFAGTLVNKHQFWLFFACRGLVGIGEASYSTVASTVIADLFVGDMRTRMLSLFYFAIPVGSGLGYIIGSKVSGAFGGNWKWGLRVTPILGIILCLLCALFVIEPARGAVEISQSNSEIVVDNEDQVVVEHGWLSDIRQIVRCKTYLWTTIGFTMVCFVTGSLAWWAPIFMGYAQSVLHKTTITENDNNISLTFGGVTCAAGFLGVGLGSELSRRYRHRDGRADALVCAFGLLSCLPFLYFALIIASKYTLLFWILLFIGETLLCMNWCPVADMLLAVIAPRHRATASAFQILLSHLFGDAGSPYVVGKVADVVRGNSTAAKDQYRGLLYAFFITTFMCAIGGASFLVASFYLVKDKAAMKAIVSGQTDENRTLISGSFDSDDDDSDNDEDDNDQVADNGSDDVLDDVSEVVTSSPVHSVLQPTQESNPTQENQLEDNTMLQPNFHPIKV